MDYGDESDDEPASTEMLKEIHDRGQYHLDVNMRDAQNKIRKRQPEWKVALKVTQNMGKVSHKVLRDVVKRFCKIYHFWVNLVQKFPI